MRDRSQKRRTSAVQVHSLYRLAILSGNRESVEKQESVRNGGGRRLKGKKVLWERCAPVGWRHCLEKNSGRVR